MTSNRKKSRERTLRNANDWAALQEAALEAAPGGQPLRITKSEYDRAERNRDERRANCAHENSGVEEIREGCNVYEMQVCYDCGLQAGGA